MQVKTFVPLEPTIDFSVLMGAVVVQDQVDLQSGGHFTVDGVEERDELGVAVAVAVGVAVAGQALADHRAGEHVQGGEQGRGAVARRRRPSATPWRAAPGGAVPTETVPAPPTSRVRPL